MIEQTVRLIAVRKLTILMHDHRSNRSRHSRGEER
jgi:hypothetical protein